MNLSNLKYYDELSPAAQSAARRNVAASVEVAKNRDISKAFYTWRKNKDHAINDPLHIKRLVNSQKAFKEIRTKGNAFLIPYIRANRVVFTDCGAYVYYVERFTMFIHGGEYIPTAEEQKALRTPYIEANERGADFHKWLYDMHHKIKHFMIR